MDKGKQIEEIMNDLNLINSLQASKIYTPIYQEAMMLVDLGYQKIGNDCVVITKDELKQYKTQDVKEFAKKLKEKVGRNFIGNSLPEIVDELLKEYEK